MSWDSIPLIKDGKTTFSEKDINPIIEKLTERTDILKEQIISETVLNGVGFSDIGLTNCQKGQFVAYDKASKSYIPATAKWNSKELVPPGEACVVGLLISEVIDDRGLILTSGIIRDSALIELITKVANPPAGEYYLTTDGAVTHDTGKLVFPIHCGTLVSTGCFVLGIQLPDFRTHTHTQYKMISSAWEYVGTSDCTWRYNNTKDTQLNDVLRTLISGMVLVVNNQVLVEDVDYTLNSGVFSLKRDFYITDNKNNLVKADKLESILFATNPFTGVVPWITDVQESEDNLIRVSQIGTSAVIGIDFPVEDTAYNNGNAVTHINNKGIYKGDVINKIISGPGILTQEVTKGTIKLSSAASLTRYIDMNIMNGNGIIYGGDNNECCIKFPAGRVAHLVGTVRAPNDAVTFKAKVFAYIDNVGSIGNLQAHVTTMTASEDKDINKATHELQFNTGSSNSSILLCTTAEFTVSENSLITLDVYANNPSSTINVHSCGVIFSTE